MSDVGTKENNDLLFQVFITSLRSAMLNRFQEVGSTARPSLLMLTLDFVNVTFELF